MVQNWVSAPGSALAPNPHDCNSITARGAVAKGPAFPSRASKRRAHNASSSDQHTTRPPGAADANVGTTACSSSYTAGGESSAATRRSNAPGAKTSLARDAARSAAMDAARGPVRVTTGGSPIMDRRAASARSAGDPRISSGVGVAVAGTNARYTAGGIASGYDAGTSQWPSGFGSVASPKRAGRGGIHCTMCDRPSSWMACTASSRNETTSPGCTLRRAGMFNGAILGPDDAARGRLARQPRAFDGASFPVHASRALATSRGVHAAASVSTSAPRPGRAP